MLLHYLVKLSYKKYGEQETMYVDHIKAKESNTDSDSIMDAKYKKVPRKTPYSTVT